MDPNKIKCISNRPELIAYLSQEGNSYSAYILEKINRQLLHDSAYFGTLKAVKTQAHHIIPLHWKGPDQKWNLISLTLEEHIQAHQLLYDNYRKLADLGASQMLSGNLKQGADTIRQMAQDTMRKNRTGFFSSATQRELGSRPRKSHKRSVRHEYVQAALAMGFVLEYIETGEVVNIEPFECPNVVSVIDKLMSHPRMKGKPAKQSWTLSEKKEKAYGASGLTRILTGHVDKKTGKRLYSLMGWRVLGINIK